MLDLNQTSIGKKTLSTLETLPNNIAQLLNPTANFAAEETKPTVKRVVLLANNPSVTSKELDNLLQPTDLLVVFNNFINAKYLATNKLTRKLPKLLFFRQIGDSKLHFGLPPRHNNVTLIEEMQKLATIGYLFTNIPYQFPTLADDPSPNDDPIDDSVALSVPDTLTQSILNPHRSSVINEMHPTVADYPRFVDIHSSAPSSGFFMYKIMSDIRRHLLQSNQPAFDILLLGFNNDEQTQHFWRGHNWDYERTQMMDLPDGVERIKVY